MNRAKFEIKISILEDGQIFLDVNDNSIIPHLGNVLRAVLSSIEKPWTPPPDLDEWINYMKFFYDKEAVLVQIGANDGMTFEDTVIVDLMKENKKVKSILIEPIPPNFDKLKENFESFSNVYLEQVAIADKEYEATMQYTTKNSGASTLREGQLQKQNLIPEKEFKVKVKRFDYIKDKYQLKDIDVLQIDTEGYDYIVLKEIFDTGFLPKLIKLEWWHLTESELNSLYSTLKNNGYSWTKSDYDVVAFKKEFFE